MSDITKVTRSQLTEFISDFRTVKGFENVFDTLEILVTSVNNINNEIVVINNSINSIQTSLNQAIYDITKRELLSNKVTSISGSSTDDQYASAKCLYNIIQGVINSISLKQDILVSGTNIKTINGNSILGSGNLTVP